MDKEYERICHRYGIASAEELEDALFDYEKQAQELRETRLHYETPARPVRAENGDYVCPRCHHRVHIKYQHCHWCGQRLSNDEIRRRPDPKYRTRNGMEENYGIS